MPKPKPHLNVIKTSSLKSVLTNKKQINSLKEEQLVLKHQILKQSTTHENVKLSLNENHANKINSLKEEQLVLKTNQKNLKYKKQLTFF
jgi:hypothetical protein